MAKRRQSLVDSALGISSFDSFSTLRNPTKPPITNSTSLIADQIQQGLPSSQIEAVLREARPVTDPPNSVGSISVLENLDLSGLYDRPIALETLETGPPSEQLLEALSTRDPSGPTRLSDPFETLTSSSLIASSVIDVSGLTALNQGLGGEISVSQLIGGARFEPGKLPSIKGITDSLSLGRDATSSVLASLDTQWQADSSILAAADLVAPVQFEDELITVAFPPDLIEGDPLSTEFEVDAIVAESQQGAQVFLALRSPKASERMVAARERLEDGSAEDLALCLTACRRALHALADSVYEPRSGEVRDRSGTPRKVHAEAFKNRLLLFIEEQISSGARRRLAVQHLASTARHLDALVDQLSKGVHADVPRDEAIDAYVETWSFIAHVARLAG